MVYIPLNSYVGFIIFFNQPVDTTVGKMNISESPNSNLTCLISIIKFKFSRFLWFGWGFFLSSLPGFSQRFSRMRAEGNYCLLTVVKCPSCVLMLPWVCFPLTWTRAIVPLMALLGKGQGWRRGAEFAQGSIAPFPSTGQANCAQSQCWCGAAA